MVLYRLGPDEQACEYVSHVIESLRLRQRQSQAPTILIVPFDETVSAFLQL